MILEMRRAEIPAPLLLGNSNACAISTYPPETNYQLRFPTARWTWVPKFPQLRRTKSGNHESLSMSRQTLETSPSDGPREIHVNFRKRKSARHLRCRGLPYRKRGCCWSGNSVVRSSLFLGQFLPSYAACVNKHRSRRTRRGRKVAS